jgi:23S rRNA pseudouridine955/2504/2580 synthase/23S rRNA pseudouridine1911/1915/1917 synthase
MKPRTFRHTQAIQVLFEDDRLVAVAKPPGLATIPGRGETDDLLHQLARQLHLPAAGSADPRLRIVHRLDKETSGVLLMAKDFDTQRHLSRQFQNGLVHKEYLAIVMGRPAEPRGEIDAPLAPQRSNHRCMCVSTDGRQSRTDWVIERKLGRFTLLRCFPKTGRPHQVRIHLKSIGLPLAVDPLYNPPPPGQAAGIFLSHYKRDYRFTVGEEERPLIGRLTLHAEKLRFVHPDGREITIECGPPKDFRAAAAQLEKLAR